MCLKEIHPSRFFFTNDPFPNVDIERSLSQLSDHEAWPNLPIGMKVPVIIIAYNYSVTELCLRGLTLQVSCVKYAVGALTSILFISTFSRLCYGNFLIRILKIYCYHHYCHTGNCYLSPSTWFAQWQQTLNAFRLVGTFKLVGDIW